MIRLFPKRDNLWDQWNLAFFEQFAGQPARGIGYDNSHDVISTLDFSPYLLTT
jgi:hypothetical protein